MESTLILLFFTIALLYSSAGFGGGSSYLAVLALYSMPMDTLRPTALLCNLVVVFGNLFVFWKHGFLQVRKCAPLVLSGLPFAFIGGYWRLSERAFFILLGLSLVAAALAMWRQNRPLASLDRDEDLPAKANVSIGGGLGLLAGLTGIGGGIFLSPVLHLLRWGSPKVIAAAASLFIFAQSASGLSGQLAQGVRIEWAFVLPLLGAVWLGGQLGVRLSAKKIPQLAIRNLTGLLVFYAGINILIRNL